MADNVSFFRHVAPITMSHVLQTMVGTKGYNGVDPPPPLKRRNNQYYLSSRQIPDDSAGPEKS